MYLVLNGLKDWFRACGMNLPASEKDFWLISVNINKLPFHKRDGFLIFVLRQTVINFWKGKTPSIKVCIK